jgi:ribosomal protein L11 methyltransferase
MDYLEVYFQYPSDDATTALLIAELSQLDYEGFEELETGLKAYIPERQFDINLLTELKLRLPYLFPSPWETKIIKERNWNAEWESSYNPVLIKNRVYIYAPFHTRLTDIEFPILIEPKMSFGTAHHETTALVIEMMLDEDFRNKRVLDMGCGTGVLAILAEKMGAREIVAIDFDTNAFENAEENVEHNNCAKISVLCGGAELITKSFDMIIANINKNTLLADMKHYCNNLKSGGSIIFSGFYFEDLADIISEAKTNSLTINRYEERNRWVAAKFDKI